MTGALEVHVLKDVIPYTGVELRPHFLLERFGLKGSAIAMFEGPCEVHTEHLVDWEDRLKNDRIVSASMLHVLGEFFGMSLRETVLWQRLLIASLQEILACLLFANGRSEQVARRGDDLFVQSATGSEQKLTVSIVTASPVSTLLHLGINLDPAGAPVPAIGLNELGVSQKALGDKWLPALQKEWDGISWACAKVRPVV